MTIILLAVIYGCEIWSLTLREKCRLRMLENRLLRKIFGPKRDKVTEDWRELHTNELQDMCSTHNIIQVIKSRTSWTRLVAHMEQRVHTGFGGETRGKDSTWKTKTDEK